MRKRNISSNLSPLYKKLQRNEKMLQENQSIRQKLKKNKTGHAHSFGKTKNHYRSFEQSSLLVEALELECSWFTPPLGPRAGLGTQPHNKAPSDLENEISKTQ